MTHFGILCTPGTGQYNTMLPLGEELKRRGHRVTLSSFPNAQTITIASGLEFIPIGLQALQAETAPPVPKQQKQQQEQLSGMAFLKQSCDLGVPLFQIRLRETPSALKQAGVECLLINSMVLDGSSIAEFMGIPFITVFSSLVPIWDINVPPFTTSWSYNRSLWGKARNCVGYRRLKYALSSFWKVIAEYRQEWNLPPISNPSQCFSQLAQISQEPRSLEFPDVNLPECLHFTGPYHYSAKREAVSFPWDKLTGQPLIYASMGTNTNRNFAVFDKIASACEDLDAQLVISLGGAIEPEYLQNLMKGNTLVVKYAPQLELLKKAKLMITHGGMNSTLECLTNGVPMVLIPVALDQPGVAARVAWTGSGEFISLNSLTSDRLKKLIRRVLTENYYKENALRLQESIRQSGGLTQAVDIIEQVSSPV